MKQGRELMDLLGSHVEAGLWRLAPVTEAILRANATLVRGMPKNVPLRAGDAVHLASALSLGERAIWTSDRHLLAAAGHVGLAGLSV